MSRCTDDEPWNAMEALYDALKRAVPDAEVELDRPADPHGHWFMDIVLDEHEVTVEWKSAAGFGVTASPLDGYGEGPEEVYSELEETRDRVVGLLQTKGRTRPPRRVLLRNIREELTLTQTELADLLGVQQSAVAKMEKS